MFAVVALVIGCSSPPKNARVAPVAGVESSEQKPPLGRRARSGAFACLGGKPRRLEISPWWKRVPPLPEGAITIDPEPYGVGPIPTRAEQERQAREKPRLGIIFCDRPLEGVAGAYLRACVNSAGEYDGAAELIAPDGSILAQGVCQKNRPIGAWVTWRRGRLETLWSRGLEIEPWRYHYPVDAPADDPEKRR